jgi:hypothetical protein
LTVAASSPTAAQLSWGGVTGALAYRVYQINGTQSTLLNDLPGLSRTYTVTGLTPASTYSFKVEAYSGPTIADSAVVSVTQPLATPQLTVSALSPTSAQLSWGGVTGALAYRIYQINGTQSVLLTALPGLSRTYTVNGLWPSATYSFKVEAYSGPTIADSAVVSVTQPLAAPQLTVKASSPTSAQLTWGGVQGALAYRVYRINGTQSVLLTALPGLSRTYTVNGLWPSATYSFKVEAYSGPVIADSAVVSVTQPLAAPQLTASALSPTSAQLSWGGVKGALAYRVYQINGTQKVLLTALPGMSRTFTVNGLTPSSTSSFMVEAYAGSIVADSAVIAVIQPA